MAIHDVAIATRDSKIRYLIVNLLQTLGIDFIICAPNDSRCGSARCIVTKQNETKNMGVYSDCLVVIEDEFDSDTVAIAIMAQLFNVRTPSLIAIGIDPGMRYGIALALDGHALYSRITSSPMNTAEIIAHWVNIASKMFSGQVPHIRIGTGSRLYLKLLLRELVAMSVNGIIELVDEHHTTFVGESDSSSAALIATRRGRFFDIDSDLSLSPKGGYVRSLKRYIAKVTDNQLELSTDDAKRILKGLISLDEYIAIHLTGKELGNSP